MAFPVKITRRRLLAGLLLLALATSLAGPWAARPMRGLLAPFLAPFGDGAMYVVTVLGDRAERMVADRPTAEDLRQLRRRLAAAEGEARYWRGQAEALRREMAAAKHFVGLYGPDADLRAALIPARVVGVGSLPYGQTRLTTAGRRQGVAAGALATTRQIVHDRSKALPRRLAVINESSLVGRVTHETQAFTARIRLVTDPGFSVRVRIRRLPDGRLVQTLDANAAMERLTREKNPPIDEMAYGDGAGGMVAPNVPKGANVQPGDVVNTYPDGVYSQFEIHVGKIVDVSPNPRNPRYQVVRIRPAANLDDVRQVFVIHPLTLEKAPGDR